MHARSTGWTGLIAVLLAIATAAAVAVWAIAAVSQRTREMAASALSLALRREVSVGRLMGDPWRGLVFEEVVVPGLRPGEEAFLTARRVTVHLDPLRLLRDLWKGRGAAGSISSVLIDEPSLRLERDAAGGWNIASLTGIAPGPAAASPFAGRVVVLSGTVRLVDRSRIAPQVFAARLADISGSASFTPSRMGFRASLVEERDDRRVVGRISGAYLFERRMLTLDLDVSGADARAWGRYLLPLPAFQITGGQVDARLHLLRAPARSGTTSDLSGRLVVRDGAARAPSRGAVVSGVRGEIHITDRWLRSSTLRGRLNGSPVEVRGDVSFFGEPHFDLAVRSSGADLRTLGRLLLPSLASRVSGVARGDVRLIGPLSAPRLEGRIEAARGQIDRQPFEELSGRFALYGQTLVLSDARGVAAGGRLSGRGLLRLGAPEFLLTLRADGADLTAMKPFSPAALPDIGGRVSGTVTAARGPGGLSAVGQAVVSQATVRGQAIDLLQASFRYGPGGLALEHATVRQGDTWMAGRGTVGPRGALALQARASTPDLAALPLPASPVPVSGLADLNARIGGTLDRPDVSGFIQITGGRVGAVALNSASGRFGLRAGTLTVEDVTARQGRTRLSGSGQVQLGGRRRLAAAVQADRVSIEAVGEAAGLPVPVTGIAEGRITLGGTLSRPSATGWVSLRDATILDQGIREAGIALQWDGRTLALESGRIQQGDSTVRLSGSFNRRTGFALDVVARGFRLGDLHLPAVGPQVEGTVDVTGRLSGPIAAPTFSAEASSGNLSVNGFRFDGAAGALRWEARTLRLDPLALRVGEERYELTGEIGLTGAPRVSMAATVTAGRLSTLLGLGGGRLGVPLDGAISGVASLEGPLANPAARLDLRLSEGRLGEQVLEAGHADLTLRDGSVTIQDLELRTRQGRVAATGRFDLRGESQIEVGGTGLELDFFRPFLRLRRPLVGQVDFTTQLGGTLASPEIGFDLAVTRGGVEGATFDSLVASAFYKDGVLQLSQALLVQSGHKLRASGSVPFNPALRRFDERTPLDFRLQLAEVNLGLLRLLTDRVAEARGAIEGEVRVNGTPAAPRLGGGIAVRDGLVRLRGLQTPVESLRLDLRFEEGAIRLAEAAAQIGGGQVSLSGALRLGALGTPAFALAVPPEAPLLLQASGVRLAVPPILEAQLDGSLRGWGTAGDPRRPPTIDGRMTVSNGTLTVAPVQGAAGPATTRLAFGGVRIEAGRDLALRLGGMRVNVEPGGALRLTGTLSAPLLEGTVAADRGTIQALGATFDLREGTATFQPPLGLRPSVSARAETQVGSTFIALIVSGTAPDALTLDLRSDPDLPRQEITRLLAQQAGFSALVSGDLEAALKAELSRRLLGPVTQAISRALGLSEFSIEYDFEKPLGLRIGKRLLSSLYVTLRSIAPQADQPGRWLYALEYRFARGWLLSLQIDSLNQRQAVLWYTARF